MAEALLAQERHDYQRKLRDMELAQLEDLMRGPALSVQAGYAGDSAGSESDYSGVSASRDDGGSRRSGEGSTATTFSFSTITQVR